jgi:hypothetical protein
MFVRLCLLSILAMSALAGPTAAGDDSAVAKWREEGDRRPIVMAQLQRFLSPKYHLPGAPRPGRGQF